MPRRKPKGWPKYMQEKRLASGTVAYYWGIPSWAREQGCTIESVALGADYGAAKQRCDDILNSAFGAWLKRDETPDATSAPFGTFDWLVAVYKGTPRYTARPAKTRKSYDAALRMVGDHVLKDGRRLGSIAFAAVTAAVADKLFEAIRFRADGKLRQRSAILAMVVCKAAWNAARRAEPKVILAENPFIDMLLSHRPKRTRPVKHDELVRFVAAADAKGFASIGTAAMIAFYWLQRQVDILGRLSWPHYRPADAPTVAKIWHHKTGEEVDLPLYDDDGSALWPELMARLDAAPRDGTLIVTREAEDRRKKVKLPWREDYFRHKVAEIRTAAKIDAEVKFMGLRHGGNTEGADAGLSDAQLRALSGHKTAAMVLIYARETANQRKEGARLRRDIRTKRGDLSE